jgi:hypothetical protein
MLLFVKWIKWVGIQFMMGMVYMDLLENDQQDDSIATDASDQGLSGMTTKSVPAIISDKQESTETEAITISSTFSNLQISNLIHSTTSTAMMNGSSPTAHLLIRHLLIRTVHSLQHQLISLPFAA